MRKLQQGVTVQEVRETLPLTKSDFVTLCDDLPLFYTFYGSKSSNEAMLYWHVIMFKICHLFEV